MFTIDEPDVVITKVKEYFTGQECKIAESGTKYKLRAQFPEFAEGLAITAKIERVDEEMYCIKVERVMGTSSNKIGFLNTFDEIKAYLEKFDLIL